jgi:hypothetical protein
MKKLILILLIVVTSCEYEPYEYIEDPKPPVEVKDYKVSFDLIRHYSGLTIKFSDLGYYSDCGFDTTSAMADFDLDGDIDILLAPQCTDGAERQPALAIFLNDKGKFTKSDIVIDNNIGLQSGNRQTIIGDYNGDKIPDLFFAAHGGHGLGGGLPGILLSEGKGFVFKDLEIGLGWYAFASSGDIDGDGDLDILLSGRENGTFINNGAGNFNFTKDIILNYTGNIGVTSLIDINNDGLVDLFYRSVDEHNYIINEYGIFDYNKLSSLPVPIYFIHDDNTTEVEAIDLDIQDRVFYDIDSDNDLDIISVSIPHNSNTNSLGQFFLVEVFTNNNGKFLDETKELMMLPITDIYVEWLRLFDLDKDGRIELFDNSSFYREWNGSKFAL